MVIIIIIIINEWCIVWMVHDKSGVSSGPMWK